MTIAKLIYLGLMVLSLGMSISSHGKKRSRQNGYHSFIGFIINLLFWWWCGFFE